MNDQTYKLRKICNAISSLARASAKLQIMGEIEPEEFPESQDAGFTAGLFEGLEILGERAASMVDEMEARAVLTNTPVGEPVPDIIQIEGEEVKSIEAAQSVERPYCPSDEIVAYICQRCFAKLCEVGGKMVCPECSKKVEA